MSPSIKTKVLSLSLLSSALLLAGCGSDSKNHAPTLTGNVNPAVIENTTLVGQYQASDEDGDALTLSLSGESSELFTLAQDGTLRFKTAPDFELAGDTAYNLTLTATENTSDALSATLTVTVTVTDEVDTPELAVVQTIAPDYLSSEVVYIDPYQQQVATGYYQKAKSDYTLDTYKDSIYHIGRYGIDTLSKYKFDNKDAQLWSYSTQDDQDSLTRNPYQLLQISDEKAYLLRYGSGLVWVVNPQAQNAEDFKLATLDISAYASNNSSGTPNPSSAVVHDDKLYIAMQRQSDQFVPDTAYIAVFDTTTDTEIETNANDEDAFKGIPIAGVNPLGGSLVVANDKVYVTTRNAYSSTDLSGSKIEAISPVDYSVTTVLSAASIPNNESAFITTSAVVSEQKGYFLSEQAFFTPSYHTKSTVHEFNPSTGEIIASNIAGTGEDGISSMKLDAAGFIWLSVQNPANPGIDIIDSSSNEKYGQRLGTTLNPSAIRFIQP